MFYEISGVGICACEFHVSFKRGFWDASGWRFGKMGCERYHCLVCLLGGCFVERCGRCLMFCVYMR